MRVIAPTKRPKPKMLADLMAFKPAILEMLRQQNFRATARPWS